MKKGAGLLVLNGGSSSLKFALYESVGAARVEPRVKGAISGLGGGDSPRWKVKGEGLENRPLPDLSRCPSLGDAARALLGFLEGAFEPGALGGVGHRVVHGGDRKEACRVTPELLAALRPLVPLAPLHQPFNLELIEQVASLHPDLPQVACFDTTFHATIPELHRWLALPRLWHDKGVKRYGFHGLSYAWIAGRLRELAPRLHAGRTLVAHLGNGASLCALKGGASFETSMGFSALDGLMMGTRPGAVDAGAILYLLQEQRLAPATLERLLYRESGLLGVSGVSSDMATLLASPDPRAREAVDLFVFRVVREAGALIGLLGGVDGLVFTGGIGEHAAPVRARILEGLGWAGLKADPKRNDAATGDQEIQIMPPGRAPEIWVIPTDEESVIARATAAQIRM